MKCQKCGSEFDSKFCPECGTPAPESIICSNCGATVSGKFCQECGTPVLTTEPMEPISFVISQQYGQLQVDTQHKLWRVLGASKSPFAPPKPGLASKLAKGTLAVMTVGASLAVEAAAKGVSNSVKTIPYYRFDQLISFELLEDGDSVTTGGIGQALVGAALFGGFGAVAGGVTAKRKTKKVINTLTIKLTINDFKTPTIMIPLLSKPVKTNSKDYQIVYTMAQKILSALDVITHNV